MIIQSTRRLHGTVDNSNSDKVQVADNYYPFSHSSIDKYRAFLAKSKEQQAMAGSGDWITGGLNPGVYPVVMGQFMAYHSKQAYDRTAIRLSRNPFVSKVISFGNEDNETFSRTVPDGPYGYGFVLERHAFLVFRGSGELRDFQANARVGMDGDPPRHHGFDGYVSELVDQSESFRNWIKQLPTDLKGIVCGGHSLGGAMAVLMAHRLQQDGMHVAAVMTYGAPCVGGDAFSNAYQLHDVTWQAQKRADPVCGLPPAWLGYRHVGKLYQIDGFSLPTLSESSSQDISKVMWQATAAIQGTMWFLLRIAFCYGPRVLSKCYGIKTHLMDNGYAKFCDEMLETRLIELESDNSVSGIQQILFRQSEQPSAAEAILMGRPPEKKTCLRTLHARHLFGDDPSSGFLTASMQK